ncbi:hypothetical protein FW778_01610 [Ginsengibacter hankyongi]|uniref:Uncharacterized protein n=1 Tax=Ginsengibacter hankyongi TaxID=2607284 RepID=A0A5J5ILL8_9BACT|nr:DUF5995 family protein [Ginsengibacter hankyongi]KAA9040764.1 hypothetical protein FW778_01610 [Ginsengibacter hankyongi]
MNASPEIITKNDLLQLQLPTTIDEVINQLEKIITYCEINNNCAGYFAVLYHKVTCKVKDCITNKDFEDGIRMERLDVTFANRYLAAFYAWIAGKPTTQSWKIAFDSVAQNKPLVLQHLLLGMNAHINLDLGIATALVMDGFSIDDIHKDFDTINSILASMIDNIEACLTKINPLMLLLNLNIYKYDEMLVQFSINTARDGAWMFAKELSLKKANDYENCISTRDESIQQLGSSIANPHGFLLKFIVKLIRLFEKKNIAAVIKLLGN